MNDEEFEKNIKRMRKLAMASIYGGWAAAEFAWLLDVADEMERLKEVEKGIVND